MPYDIRQNYSDCKGYAVVGPDGTVRGCHSSRKDAEEQRMALYAVEEKNIPNSFWAGTFDPGRKTGHDKNKAN